MQRREFITHLGGVAVAWPLAARAQQPTGMRRIGVLIAFAPDDPESKARIAKFHQALDKLGWSEGRQVHIDARFAAGNPDQYSVFAKQLVPGIIDARNDV